jgi:NADH dehydrogenase
MTARLDVVTGAFSYTGSYITEELLARGRAVRTLTRHPQPEHPLATRIETAPLVFDQSLVSSLGGADTLYNTYWIRFERGSETFAQAVENTKTLVTAAREAGVRRVVHLSVSNPSERSPFPYFSGKAHAERAVRECGLGYAIIRPTLVFGRGDVLLSNVAYLLRRAPFFLVLRGGYEVQPVSVADTARIAVDCGLGANDMVVDAAGPERFPFGALVRELATAVGSRARIWEAGRRMVLLSSRLAGAVLRDVLLSPDELDALAAGLLVSKAPALGKDRIGAWLADDAERLGRSYTSELARNFRPYE